jgi:hypothetical protein
VGQLILLFLRARAQRRSRRSGLPIGHDGAPRERRAPVIRGSGSGSAAGYGGAADAFGVFARFSRNRWRDWTPPGTERHYPCRVRTLGPVHSCLPCTPGAGPPPRKRPPLIACRWRSARTAMRRDRGFGFGYGSFVRFEIPSPAGSNPTPLAGQGAIRIYEAMSR